MEKTEYFNIESVYCSVNIKPDIIKNYWKNMRENHKFFEITLGIVLEFFFVFSILLLYLACDFSSLSLRSWNSPLFIGARRRTLYLIWCQILAINFTWKDPKHWFKVAIMSCEIWCRNWLVRLATLGWCLNHYGVNWLERTTLGCSQMSGQRLHVNFIKFGGKMKQ